MPSPVGHALGAIAIGWAVAAPATTSRRSLLVQAGVLAAIGMSPDLDLLVDRHSRETHSLGAALIVATAAAVWRWPIAPTRARIWLTALLAYFSHPLFDALSPDGTPPIGVMIRWPFSREHWQTGVALFMPIWRHYDGPVFFTHNALALLRELALLLPIVALVWRWRSRVPVRRLLASAVVAILALGAPANAQPAPPLRWGADAEGGAPFIEADPARPDRLRGFDVEIAELIAKDLGRRAEFIQITFTSLDQSVARGDFDVGLGGVEDSPARRAALAVTVPYYEFREVLTVRAADRDRFRALSDLRGRRVATLGGTLAYEILLAAERDHGLRPVSYDDDVHPYTDLVAGRVDAVLLDHVIAERSMRRVGGIVTHPEAVAVGHYVGILAPAQRALRDQINGVLEAAMQDGRLETIFRRWQVWNADQPALYARVLAGETPQGRAADSGFRDGAEEGQPRMSSLAMTRAYLPALFSAAAVTLVLSGLSMSLAILLGAAIAIGRVYGPAIVRLLLTGYVEVMRGTPILLQLFVIYYGLASVIRLPAFAAALIGLGLNYAAYESEIYRGALEAVPKGQLEAARVLGFTERQTLRLVRGPQAFRLALAPMTNDFVAMLKDSSLVSVLTVMELTKQTQIFATNLGSWVVPGLLCAGLYLAMSLPLAHLARRLEERWKAATIS
ncbi:MAG: ABC transporter permease subunit [Acidobacteria bacterium]|nr:ABC transporter permease subunit [Acidobacteriota bacterium]